MMDDTNPFSQMSPGPDNNTTEQTRQPEAPAQAPVSESVIKFQSCRWRCDPDAGAFCTHRDVLPFAGKEGFVADSWCPDCGFYKLRRTPKKREYPSY